MTTFKKAYRKSWILGVWSGRLDSGHLGSGLLNSEQLDTLDSARLDPWTLDGWTLEEFLIISGTLRSMYYGSVERAANDCYNSILLQLILQLIL